MMQKPEKMARKPRNRRLRNTISMSRSTLAKEVGAGSSAARAGSRKNSRVPSRQKNEVTDDMIRTYSIPRFSRTPSARIGPSAPPMLTSV